MEHFSSSGFMPHGHCYLWQPALVLTHVISDFLIGSAYVAISLSLYAIVKKTKLEFSAVVLSFGVFIGACGLTHFMEIWNLWNANYWAGGIVKVVTALASVTTAIYLHRLGPKILAVAEAARETQKRHQSLEELNLNLQSQLEATSIDLQTNKHLLETILNQMPLAVVVANAEGKLLFANKQLDTVWKHGFIPADNFEEYKKYIGFHADGRQLEGHEWPLARALSTGEIVTGEETDVLLGDGSHGVIRLNAAPVRDNRGKIIAGIVLSENVTEQIKAKRQLQESEDRFRQLANSIPQLAWIADETGYIYWYNDRWYQYTGTQPKDMEGWGWQSVHDSSMLPVVLERWKKSIETGKPFKMEFPLRSASGEYRWFLTLVNPIRDSESKVINWFGTNTDINEKKQAEHELARAKEEAERASQLKSAFLANMSHEIRTPLGIMLGSSELISDPNISQSEREQYTATLRANGHQLTELVNDILDLSKVEAGHLKVETLSFNPNALVDEIVSTLHPLAKTRALEIKTDLNLPTQVFSDPLRLRQILWNLIGNALKFTEKGSVNIRGQLEGTQIIFEVQDTGIGINEKDRNRLFKPFSQADESMTRKYGGTGLGLALSQKLAQLLGGNIALVRTEVGKGSIFRLAVENHSSTKATGAQMPVSRAPVAGQNIDLANLRILVVDDVTDNQILMKRILEKRGAIIEIASNGAEAVERALHEKFDVILMDIQMPVMDGYTAVEKLRASGYTTPIIAVTAHAMEETQRRCREVGCDDFAPKPINPSSIAAKIATCVGRR